MVRRKSTKTDFGVTADGKGNITWDTKTIHAITRAEMVTAGAKYRRAIDDGALKQCSREEWEAQRAAHLKAKKEAAEKAAQEKKDAAATADETAAETPKAKKGGF